MIMPANTGSPYLTIPEIEQFGNIRHVFTTRQGGLGKRDGEIKSPGEWQAVAQVFGIVQERLVTVNQVHGSDIIKVTEKNYLDAKAAHADGIVTDTPAVAVAVETADCVPVLLLDPACPAVAAVHAGWRSTVEKIVEKAVFRMQHEYGSDPSRIIAGIGPAIGPECYEVDEPVMRPVRSAFPFWKEAACSRGNGRFSLDLPKLNSLALMRAGLKEKNIHAVGLCTACNRDQFYSFRAEGKTGRMLSAIMITP